MVGGCGDGDCGGGSEVVVVVKEGSGGCTHTHGYPRTLPRPPATRIAFPWWYSLFVFGLGIYVGALAKEIRLFGMCRLCGVPVSSFLAVGAY